LKEKGIPFLKAEGYMKTGQENDLGVEIVGALRSPTGNGEIIKIGSINKPTGQEYLFNLTIPHLFERNGPFLLTAKSSEENTFFHSSFKQHCTSLTAEYYHDQRRQHQIIGEYSIRDEIPMLSSSLKEKGENEEKNVFSSLTRSTERFLHSLGSSSSSSSSISSSSELDRHASEAVLSSATSSVKSSLKYIWTPIDTRDSSGNPTIGEYLQSSFELALPPGDAQFFKTDLTTQFHRRLGPNYQNHPGLTFSLISSLGILYPLAVLFPSFYYTQNTIRNSTNPLTSYLSDR
jgi:outer membrane protein assembly factor BamA